jgi:hypothetical protein
VPSSTLSFLGDLVQPIALGGFVVASLVLIARSARTRRATSSADGLPGMRPALSAGILVSVPLVFLSVLLESHFNPGSTLLETALLPFLLIAGPVVLAVLDVYAIWPPVRRTVAGAVGRAAVGVVLAFALFTLVTQIHTTVRIAELDEHLVERRAAIAARSQGLSIEVAVVGAKLGAVKENGRLVDSITIDLTVRSADQIQLREAYPEAFSFNEQARIGPASFVAFDVSRGIHLPTLIPAGFEQSYRLTASLSTAEFREEYVAGPWEARVTLFGPLDEMNLTIDYAVMTTFTVSDTP